MEKELKELTVKEALLLLVEKYPEQADCVFDKKYRCNGKLRAVDINHIKNGGRSFMDDNGLFYDYCAIEVPNEYRHMTEEEHSAWLVTVGYKNHQMRCKGCDWCAPFDLNSAAVDDYEYRTVQEIDGKIVYGQPQEFKIKV